MCKVTGGTTYTRVDEPFAQMFPFGNSRWFVQLDQPGTQDIAFEIPKGKPRVVTLTPAAPGGPRRICRPDATRPTETVKLLVGDELDLGVGRRLKAVLVGSPSVVYVAPTVGDLGSRLVAWPGTGLDDDPRPGHGQRGSLDADRGGGTGTLTG